MVKLYLVRSKYLLTRAKTANIIKFAVFLRVFFKKNSGIFCHYICEQHGLPVLHNYNICKNANIIHFLGFLAYQTKIFVFQWHFVYSAQNTHLLFVD